MQADEEDLQDATAMLPQWATKDSESGLYLFPDRGVSTARLRRVESALQFKRRGAIVRSASDYSAVASTILNSSGQIDPTVSGIASKGSVPPFVADGQFAATATTTSITWYYDGTNGSTPFVLRRGNGTTFSVPRGSLTISNLLANTLYYFYPYWPNSGCAVGWIVGTVGSPQIAFTALSNSALADQSRQDREALTAGAMSYTTPAAGTNSGSGGGGGAPGGGCVMNGTDIEPLLDAWDYRIEIQQQAEWVRLTAAIGTLACTPDHALYDPFGNKRQADSFRGDWIVTRDGDQRVLSLEHFVQPCTKHKVVMTQGHLYWANGYLSHNAKAAQVK